MRTRNNTQAPWRRRRRRLLAITLLCACASGAVSCRRTEVSQPARSDRPNAVAVVAGTVITREALQNELLRQFRFADSGLSTEQKLGALETLIRNEAVYSKAIAQGFDQTPQMQARIRNLVISQFKEQQFKREAPVVTEEEIRTFYEANAGRFAQPAMLRGAMIFLSVPATATTDKKIERQQEAERIWSEARAATNERDFAQVVVRHSEDQTTRYRGGDIGWVTREAPGVEPAVVDALSEVPETSAFAPLVQGKDGFYVVKLLGRREAGCKPLSQVREAISYQLSRQKTEQAERDFYTTVKAGLEIDVNQAALETGEFPRVRAGERADAVGGACAIRVKSIMP